MKEPYWIDLRIALALHGELIREHGGADGLRQAGQELLESALTRPRQRFAYEPESDLCALAAAYLVDLGKGHGFLDGNKRVAFATAATFLRMNGLKLRADEAEAYAVVIDIMTNRLTESELASWLQEHVENAPKLDD